MEEKISEFREKLSDFRNCALQLSKDCLKALGGCCKEFAYQPIEFLERGDERIEGTIGEMCFTKNGNIEIVSMDFENRGLTTTLDEQPTGILTDITYMLIDTVNNKKRKDEQQTR